MTTPLLAAAASAGSPTVRGSAHRAESGRRLVGVDAVRLICIFWVIWIHTTEAPELRFMLAFVRFRMPVFVILSVFFLLASQEKHPQRTFVKYAVQRLKNLYVPFLAWSAIYYLLHGCYDYFLRHAGWPAVSRGILIHGQAVHLWFVPFIVAVDILTFPVARWLLAHASRPALIAWPALLLGVIAAAAVGPGFTDSVIDYDYPAHLKDLLWRVITLGPCIPLGLAAFFIFKSQSSRPKTAVARSGWLVVLGVAIVVAAVAAHVLTGPHPLPESAAALGIVLLALVPMHAAWLIHLARWGGYSFGMYLAHLVFVDAFHILREFVFHLPPSWWFDLLSLLLCVPATLALTLALDRSRFTRWLVPSSASVRRVTAKSSPL